MGLYRLLTDLGAPAISVYLRRRRTRGREDKARFEERLGHPSLPRPAGKLLWCHAASVGEAMSVLSLIAALRESHPDWRVLLTTGTVTSAQLLATRLPQGVIHQYVPVDRWPYVSRFLDHWRPDLALWVESELWPNMLAALRQRRTPALLLNGRMSARSFRHWSLARGWARDMLGTFALALAQTEAEQARFKALGMTDVRCIGNLKCAAVALPCDEGALRELKAQLGTRKAWLMASTHSGEDEIALAAHDALRVTRPNLLTIIAPRHAARGDAIAELLRKRGVKFAQRSRGDAITPDAAVYLADTMGELGLFYRLAPVVCLGGSFVWGGHNPVEPAQLGCAMIFGPRMTNFAALASEFLEHGGALQIESPACLADGVAKLLDDAGLATSLSVAARQLMEKHRHVLDNVMRVLAPYLTEDAA